MLAEDGRVSTNGTLGRCSVDLPSGEHGPSVRTRRSSIPNTRTYIQYSNVSASPQSLHINTQLTRHNPHAVHQTQSAHIISYLAELILGPLLTTNPDYTITHNLTPFISMQNHQHPIYHEEVHKIFPTLELFGVGLIPSFPPRPLAPHALPRRRAEARERRLVRPFLRLSLGGDDDEW